MSKTLFVSDFDDTLAKTDARVFVTNNGEQRTLTPGEFATYQARPGDQFDFSEFEQLKNPQPIKRFVNLLKKAIGRADKVAILTARGHTRPVAQFLKMQGITSGVAIAALGDNDPEKKAQYIEKHIADGFDKIAFIDDSPKNIEAATRVKERHPKVKLLVHQVKEEPVKKQGLPEVELRPIKKTDDDYVQVDKWIHTDHYRGMWPQAVQSILGVYLDGKLSGTLVYGIGGRPQAARDIFGPGVIENNQLWELQRAFTTEEAKEIFAAAVKDTGHAGSLGSMVISRGNEYIRTQAKTKDGKPIKAIVSYADSAQGHGGSVYKASNATYLGEQPPRSVWAITDPKTKNTIEQPAIKKSTRERLVAAGYVIKKVTPDTGKHKFLYPLGKDQNERDELLAKVVKPIFSYPKPGEPSKQIPNAAKEKVAKRQQPKQQPQQSKREVIKQLLRSKVTNPETGEKIFVQTALRNKQHPAYRQAIGMVTAYAKKHHIRIKQR